ncbi:hypothetical protein EGW08_016676, partial [Elysia chlorotica]
GKKETGGLPEQEKVVLEEEWDLGKVKERHEKISFGEGYRYMGEKNETGGLSKQEKIMLEEEWDLGRVKEKHEKISFEKGYWYDSGAMKEVGGHFIFHEAPSFLEQDKIVFEDECSFMRKNGTEENSKCWEIGSRWGNSRPPISEVEEIKVDECQEVANKFLSVENLKLKGNTRLLNSCIMANMPDGLPGAEMAAKTSTTERKISMAILCEFATVCWSLSLSLLHLLSLICARICSSVQQQASDSLIHLYNLFSNFSQCMLVQSCFICLLASTLVKISYLVLCLQKCLSRILSLFHVIVSSFILTVFCSLCWSLSVSPSSTPDRSDSRLILSEILVIVLCFSFLLNTCSLSMFVVSSNTALCCLLVASRRQTDKEFTTQLLFLCVLDGRKKKPLMITFMYRSGVTPTHSLFCVSFIMMNTTTLNLFDIAYVALTLKVIKQRNKETNNRDLFIESWNCTSSPSMPTENIRDRNHKEEDKHSSSCSTCSSVSTVTPEPAVLPVFPAPLPIQAPYPDDTGGLPPYPPPRPTSSFSTRSSIMLRIIVTLVLIALLVLILARVFVNIDFNFHS